MSMWNYDTMRTVEELCEWYGETDTLRFLRMTYEEFEVLCTILEDPIEAILQEQKDSNELLLSPDDNHDHIDWSVKIVMGVKYYHGSDRDHLKSVFFIRKLSDDAFFHIVDVVAEAIKRSFEEIKLHMPEVYKKLKMYLKTKNEREREVYLHSLWKQRNGVPRSDLDWLI